MSVPASSSVPSIKTTTSTQFTDANSKFEDASATPPPENNKTSNPVIQNESREDSQESTEDIVGKTDEIEVKTEQPTQVKEPKAFLSKEEKIKQLQEQKKNKGYQRQSGESDCGSYFCSNNLLEVLDLPDLHSLLCCCCLACCNSTVGSGTAAAKGKI